MTKGEREMVISFMDRGEWKNSWHMKKDRYGYVDFRSQANLDQILRECDGAEASARRLIVTARAVRGIVQECTARDAAEGGE